MHLEFPHIKGLLFDASPAAASDGSSPFLFLLLSHTCPAGSEQNC